MSVKRIGAGLAGLLVAAAASGQDAESDDDDFADADFLEYLGSWDGSDEEWEFFEDDTSVAGMEPVTPQPDPPVNGSMEQENES